MPIQQPASNAQGHAYDVRDPVVYVGASIKAGLDEFNGAAISAGGYEYRKQPKAARAGQREGERCEGYEMHELVAALRRRGRLVQWPEHRDSKCERHNNGEENVEVLAHPLGFIWQAKQRQACAAGVRIRGKVESCP